MTEEMLFTEALEITDPVGRARFLDWACGGDPSLRARVERLLERHERAGDFLARSAAALETGQVPGQRHRQ
jgi:eukaryotic-like serine/threonine-protein kinase